jgi:hypothetical protein
VIEQSFQTTVARSPEGVFDFLVDLRNAPLWETNCQEVEKTSDGPIGKGMTRMSVRERAAAALDDDFSGRAGSPA